jgi:hypothetical protein
MNKSSSQTYEAWYYMFAASYITSIDVDFLKWESLHYNENTLDG